MKRLLLLTAAIVLLVGCEFSTGTSDQVINETDDVTYWVNYYPTQCNASPWGDTLDETKIISYYQTNLGVTVDAIEVTPPATGFFTCAACGCATGTQVSIQTDTAGKAILLEHGFTVEATTEDWPQDDITNIHINENINLSVEAETTEVTSEDVEISETELVDPAIDPNEPVLSEVDIALQARAEQWRAALTTYYTSHGSYPDTLADLNVTIDSTGLTYTPIGITPADYYDLSVDYSTGREVVNP